MSHERVAPCAGQRRRTLLKLALTSAAAIPLAGLVTSRPVRSQQLEPLSPEERAAKALSYVDDAAQSDSPQRGSDQFCSNCNLVRSESGSRRQCAIFPGKSVSENGWCSAWVKKS